MNPTRRRAVPARVFVVLALVTAVLVAGPPPARARPAGAEGVFYAPPVDAPVADPFRPPAGPYGAGNRGLAYDLAPGTPVGASAPGVVVFAGSVAGTRAVTIRHADGLRTSYTFLDSVLVGRGATVRAGDPVGTASAGFHFTVRDHAGDYLDPESVFGQVTVDVRLVWHDEFAPPTPPTLASEHRYLQVVVFFERESWLDAQASALLDFLVDQGLVKLTELQTALATLQHVIERFQPLTISANVLEELWEALTEDCTEPGVGVAPPAGERVALLVGGLGSSSDAAGIDDLDLAALGYDAGDAIRFSYEGGRIPDADDLLPGDGLHAIAAAPYGPEATNDDIRAQGAELADLIMEAAALRPGEPIDVYAHSMGGLVLRFALYDLAGRVGGLDVLGTVTTIATPHQGADVATLASVLDWKVHALLDVGSHLSGLGVDASGTSVGQMAEHSPLIAELAARGVPEGVDLRTIGARYDYIVTADKAEVDGHPSATIGRLSAHAHQDVVGDPAITRELLLGLAGMAPTCRGIGTALADAVVPELVSLGTDAASAALAVETLASVDSKPARRPEGG